MDKVFTINDLPNLRPVSENPKPTIFRTWGEGFVGHIWILRWGSGADGKDYLFECDSWQIAVATFREFYLEEKS